MTVIMRIIGAADGTPTGFEDTFLLNANPDGDEGRGTLSVTRRIERAKHFETQAEALACWKAQSTTHPLRPDGKPNRPLTAFTVEILTL